MEHWTERAARHTEATFMAAVFGWMTAGLLVTAAASAWVLASPDRLLAIVENPLLFFGLIGVELVLVWILLKFIDGLSATAATVGFLFYSAVNGLTLAVVVAAYTPESVTATFLITAATFGAMALYGYTTRTDLSAWGNILLMALVGLLIAGAVNLFLDSSTLHWLISVVGVLTFVGLTAYDVQQIKRAGESGIADPESRHHLAILGALALYLNFVNLFLHLLRLLGDRDD